MGVKVLVTLDAREAEGSGVVGGSVEGGSVEGGGMEGAGLEGTGAASANQQIYADRSFLHSEFGRQMSEELYLLTQGPDRSPVSAGQVAVHERSLLVHGGWPGIVGAGVAGLDVGAGAVTFCGE